MKNTILVLIAALMISTAYGQTCKEKRQKRREAKCYKWGICKTVKDSTWTKIVYRDTIIYKDRVIDYTDTALFRHYLECNEQNNVVITELKNVKGKYTTLKYKVDNGILTTVAYVQIRDSIHDTIYIEKAIKETETGSQTTVEKKVNELTGWQYFQLWSGRIFWLIIIIYALYRLVKAILNKYTGGFTFFSKRR